MLLAFRSAARSLARWHSSAAAILTLAVGIGTATGLYAVARASLADLPGVPAVDRVARIYASNPSLGVERSRTALPELDGLVAHATSFGAIGGYADEDATLGTGPDATVVVAGYASPGFFTAMGVAPAAGRAFTAADLSGPPVAMLSEPLWRRLFAGGQPGDARVVVDGVARAVVGVMPSGFRYPFLGVNADLWIPLARTARDMPAIVTVYGRLRHDGDWSETEAELKTFSGDRAQWIWRAIPISADTHDHAVSVYAGALGPALLVLLIACVNVACLLLARGVARERELGVRRSLGGTRAVIVWQLLGENLLLAIVSGAFGAALAVAMLRVLASTLASVDPMLAGRLWTDIRLLPVALAVSVLACMLSGIPPAVRLSRGNVAASLQGVPAAHRVPVADYGARDAIVFAEVACAVGFVVWTAMLYTFSAQLNGIAPRFPAGQIVAMRVPAGHAEQVIARVSAVPGVASTAISSGTLGGARERIQANGHAMIVSRIPVGIGYFDTLGLRILRGRAFDEAELHGNADVAVLGETGARRLAPDGDAVGLRLKMIGRRGVVVIGVCQDAFDAGALARADLVDAELYVPYLPIASGESAVLARTLGDAHTVARAVAAAAQPAAGSRPVRPIVMSDEFRDRSARGQLALMRIRAMFAILTLMLAAGGVFAVISQSIAQRTREFGIRLAIGATRARVLRMVLLREGKLIVAAVATGVIFTMAATRALFVEVARLSAILPSMWIGAVLLSGAMAALAVAFAAYRIVRLEPAAVLRRS